MLWHERGWLVLIGSEQRPTNKIRMNWEMPRLYAVSQQVNRGCLLEVLLVLGSPQEGGGFIDQRATRARMPDTGHIKGLYKPIFSKSCIGNW